MVLLLSLYYPFLVLLVRSSLLKFTEPPSPTLSGAEPSSPPHRHMAKAYPSELQQLVLGDYVTHFKPMRSRPEIWAGVTEVAKRVGGSY